MHIAAAAAAAHIQRCTQQQQQQQQYSLIVTIGTNSSSSSICTSSCMKLQRETDMSLDMGFSRSCRGALLVTSLSAVLVERLFLSFGCQSALKFFLVHLWALFLMNSVAPTNSIFLNLWNAAVSGKQTGTCRLQWCMQTAKCRQCASDSVQHLDFTWGRGLWPHLSPP
jgi:hypothetical protein